MPNNMINSSFHWFEFLINRDLLLEHLKQPDPDPSASVLLVQFVENAEKYSAVITSKSSSNGGGGGGTIFSNPESNWEITARETKVKSFKSMALQIAAYLDWDLEILALLPYGVQHSLMKYASEYVEENQFICSIFHRWVLRNCQAPLKKASQQDPVAEAISKILSPEASLGQLLTILPPESSNKKQTSPKSLDNQIILVPTMYTFAKNIPDFSIGKEIPLKIFYSILHLDIGIHLLYKGTTARAAYHFKQAKLPENYIYFKLPKTKLNAYYQAVGILPTEPDSPEDTSELQAVEFARMLRKGAMGKIKKLVGGNHWEPTFGGGSGGPGGGGSGGGSGRWKDVLHLDQKEKQRNGDTIFDLETRLLETQSMIAIKDILVKLHGINPPSIQSGGPSTSIPPTRSYWKLFSHIEIPIPIQHAVNKFPPGPFQDYIFILIAKSKQFLHLKHYKDSRAVLGLARTELHDHLQSIPPGASSKSPYYYNIRQLVKILDWELVYVDIFELFEEWALITTSASYKKFLIDLSQKCKEIVHTTFHLTKTNDISPRSELLEAIVMALLNLGEFSFIVEQGLNKWPFLEFLSLLAKVCCDLAERKDSSSNYRELWYAALPTFSSATNKRLGTKNPNIISSRSVFMWIIEHSHSHLLVSLFVSLLARFHNHIQDDATLQITSADFLHIWPNILDDVTTSSEVKSRVSGSSKLNSNQIFDVLLNLLIRSSQLESSWLKTIGDVYLASNNPSAAMKSYLEYLALNTDFFEKHSCSHWNDNGLFRRMIKCTELMQAFTQAVTLCQFLTEVDYSLAFGLAQEKMTSDASDALYGFIWDLAILEFLINLHTRRNEIGKRQQAIKVMGLLELNGNNNEEIQREAMHLRKSQFMRTLAKLYIFV